VSIESMAAVCLSWKSLLAQASMAFAPHLCDAKGCAAAQECPNVVLLCYIVHNHEALWAAADVARADSVGAFIARLLLPLCVRALVYLLLRPPRG
jgi:hypothetical protein